MLLSTEYELLSWRSLCTTIAKLAVFEEHISDRHKVRVGHHAPGVPHAVGPLGRREGAASRSPQVKAAVHGVGEKIYKYLEEAEKDRVENKPPPHGKFALDAAAMLVALLEHAEAHARTVGAGTVPKCAKSELLQLASERCEQRFRPLPGGAATGGAEVLCSALQQMETLELHQLVKERQDEQICPQARTAASRAHPPSALAATRASPRAEWWGARHRRWPRLRHSTRACARPR